MSDIQSAAERWHTKFAKAFITSVSTGEGEYFIKVKFRTMTEMHDAYDAMATLADLCIHPHQTTQIMRENENDPSPTHNL